MGMREGGAGVRRQADRLSGSKDIHYVGYIADNTICSFVQI
jgi:hypothetical protein